MSGELKVTERHVQLMKAEVERCAHQNAPQRLCCYCAARQLARELRYQGVDELNAERDRLRAENAALRRRVRLARAALDPEVDYEIGEGSRGEIYDPLRDVMDLLDLRRPLPPRPKRHGGGRGASDHDAGCACVKCRKAIQRAAKWSGF